MHFDHLTFGYLFLIPFIGMLASIALAPLCCPAFWHHHALKVSLGWASITLILLINFFGLHETSHQFIHMLMHEYIPFILMIGSLFTVTGGIHIVIRGRPSPLKNTAFLLIGALAASLIGTTGAAMLLIRPFIELNKSRHYKIHLVIFFIFIIANIGGTLTPLGDPPLFLGYLNGIPFNWPFWHLLKPFCLVIIPLLTIFCCVDYYLFRQDLHSPSYEEQLERREGEKRINITGQLNFLFLLSIVLIVWLSGLGSPKTTEPIFFGLTSLELSRNIGLLVIMGLSYLFTPGTVRHYNHFSWAPFKEVGEIFLGIFVTLIPVIAMLQAGVEGPFKELIEWANPGGSPSNMIYFWLTGSLSAFLDNAPTYLVFFNMAAGSASPSVFLVPPLNQTLIAISAGAVFMGAITYIGNAPNFMVKSIAESKHIKMPSFFAYMLWSLGILIPVFVCMSYVMF